MKISHVALYVSDLEKAKNFYEKYFTAQSGVMYHNIKTSLRTYFLKFDDNSRIEIMTRDNLRSRNKEITESGYIHIAMSVGSKDRVDSVTKTLEEDGYKIISYPRTTGDGYYESVVLDSENNQIEIVE